MSGVPRSSTLAIHTRRQLPSFSPSRICKVLATHPDDPDVEEIRTSVERDRDRYLRWQRDLLGWAIVVGRKG
jgi:hypothetical protein